MAITFSVSKNKFPDNIADSTTATNIATWLNTLTVTHVYGIDMTHKNGFWDILIVYD